MDGTVRYPFPQFFLVTSTVPEAPSSYSKASKHSDWCKAMDEEFIALMKNATWSLILARRDMNIIGSGWIFKTKCKSAGSFE